MESRQFLVWQISRLDISLSLAKAIPRNKKEFIQWIKSINCDVIGDK